MITEHTVCALPEDHRDWRHFAIKVQRRGSGYWVLVNEGFYLTPDGEWTPSIADAIQLDERSALELAEEVKPSIEVNGFTVADALARSRR